MHNATVAIMASIFSNPYGVSRSGTPMAGMLKVAAIRERGKVNTEIMVNVFMV